MRVLIVEDDDFKQARLAEFLSTSFGAHEIQSARSLQSGLKAVLQEKWDVIFLDMTMRNFDRTSEEEGGRPHAFAGLEILRQMKRSRILTPVIVVTHFDRSGEELNYTTLDRLKQELKSSFINYKGTVQYKSNVDEWQEQLANLIRDSKLLGEG